MSDSEKRYILVVDDEVQVIRGIIRELSGWAKQNNIRVTGAVIGREALEFIENHENEIELVIADMRMPGMTGGDMLLTIQDRYPDVATILLTAYTDREELAKAVKAGIYAYIPKPWETEELIEEIENAIACKNKKKQQMESARILDEQFKHGEEFQRKTLHVDLPTSDDIRFSLLHLPAECRYCNGDYYDVIPLSPKRFIVLIGDIAAKGLMGAFVTIMIKSILYKEYIDPKQQRNEHVTPSSLLEWLNRQLFYHLQNFDLLLVSFAVGIVDTEGMTLTYGLADHTPIACIRDGEFVTLSTEGTGLGAIEELRFEEKVFSLHSGDTLLFMSDGLANHVFSHTRSSPLSLLSNIEETNSNGRFIEQVHDLILEENEKGTFDDDVTLIAAELR